MSMPVFVTSRHRMYTVADGSDVPPASNVFMKVQLPSAFTGATSPMPPPKLKMTCTSTMRTPWMGDPSARTFGQRLIDLNDAAVPSEIEAGLLQGRCERGVHTPFRSQCADAADAAGTYTLEN